MTKYFIPQFNWSSTFEDKTKGFGCGYGNRGPLGSGHGYGFVLDLGDGRGNGYGDMSGDGKGYSRLVSYLRFLFGAL